MEDKNLELIGKISELHMEMQTAKVVQSQEMDEAKLACAKKLRLLDLEAKDQYKRDNRHSLAFKGSSRLTKIGGNSLARSGKYSQASDEPGGSKNRFSVVNDLLEADKEMNGEEFSDVYAGFEYTEAQEMSEPREKLYLKVLT